MWTIHWNEVKPEYLGAETFEAVAKQTDNSDLIESPFFPNQRLASIQGSYSSLGSKTGRCELRVFDGAAKRYIYISSKAVLDSIDDEPTGLDAYEKVNGLFEEQYKESIFTAFSGREHKEEYKAIKNCVPIQISYANPRFLGKIIPGVYKADISSAFPSKIVGKKLPMLEGCKRAAGRVKPTEEYPFAFYVNSHHLAIYGELDTRDFDCEYYGTYYKETYKDDVKEEETILCKACDKSLDAPFTYLYERRNESKDFKFYMNACIGYFHKRSNPTLSAIAAVVIARCDWDMISRCNKLREDRNIVLFIATDSIAWAGRENDLATEDKYLGSFTYESKNCRFYAIGPKAYQVESDGKVITKYAGMSKAKQESIAFGMLEYDAKYSEERIYQLAKTEKKGIYYPERVM